MKMAFPHCAADRSLLPMEVQVGDRFTEGGFDWEVLKRPAVMHGAKTLRARVVRPGLPETEREVTWIAHERVTIRLAEAVIVHGQFSCSKGHGRTRSLQDDREVAAPGVNVAAPPHGNITDAPVTGGVESQVDDSTRDS